MIGKITIESCESTMFFNLDKTKQNKKRNTCTQKRMIYDKKNTQILNQSKILINGAIQIPNPTV